MKCGSLKDASKKEDFLEELSEEYEEIREEHYDSLKVYYRITGCCSMKFSFLLLWFCYE